MKNKLIKLCLSLLIAAFTLFSAILAVGCYAVESAKLEDIVGTYKVTAYSEKEDVLTAKSVVCYVVIREDGTGYHVYKDSETPLVAAELKCRFIADAEDENKYEYVEIEFENNNEWAKFGFNAKGKTLTFKKAKYTGNLLDGDRRIDYTINVRMERVDSATDLSYVQQQFDETIVPLPYGGKKLGGFYYFFYAQDQSGTLLSETQYEEPLVYFYLSLDVSKRTGKAWYMKKSDEKKREESFSFSVTDEGETFAISIGELKIAASDSTYLPYLYIPVSATVSGGETFVQWVLNRDSNLDEDMIEEKIESEITKYENSKTTE